MLDLCKKVEEDNQIEVVYCGFCDENACNSSDMQFPSYVLFVFLPVLKALLL